MTRLAAGVLAASPALVAATDAPPRPPAELVPSGSTIGAHASGRREFVPGPR